MGISSENSYEFIQKIDYEKLHSVTQTFHKHSQSQHNVHNLTHSLVDCDLFDLLSLQISLEIQNQNYERALELTKLSFLESNQRIKSEYIIALHMHLTRHQNAILTSQVRESQELQGMGSNQRIQEYFHPTTNNCDFDKLDFIIRVASELIDFVACKKAKTRVNEKIEKSFHLSNRGLAYFFGGDLVNARKDLLLASTLNPNNNKIKMNFQLLMGLLSRPD